MTHIEHLLQANEQVLKAEAALKEASMQREQTIAAYQAYRGNSAPMDGEEFLRCTNSNRFVRIVWRDFDIQSVTELKFEPVPE